MEIKGKVHLMFEQSGVFKREFQKLGYDAFDYDIQNNFDETDHIVDLFKEIETAYGGGKSIFDSFTKNDVIFAFFPCIYFCEANARLFRFEDSTHKTHTHERAVQDMIERSRQREKFWELAIKMFCVCDTRGLRLIVENPYSTIHFLQQYFPYRPCVIDMDRSRRGDKFKKPTQYWFLNCEPTHNFSPQYRKAIPVNFIDDRSKNKNYKKMREEGVCICSEAKSTMTSDYARNFICDFVIGKKQTITQPTLFDI